MQTFKKLLSLLSPHEKKRASFLLIIITIAALLDMISVASILPFITVLTNPNHIETNFILSEMFLILKIFGIKTNQQFIFALGILTFILLVISLLFKAFTIYMQTRFVFFREYSIGKRLLEGYLHKRYSWFLDRHSTDLGKNILSEISTVISNGIGPIIELFAKSMVAILLLTLLIISDPKIAVTVGLILGLAYLIVFYFVRNYLNLAGKKRLINNQLRFAAINETFSAIKEIKLAGLEKTYVKLFSNSAQIYAKTQASFQVISQLPRFILEAIAFSGILLIILYIVTHTGNFNNALPTISLYIFVGYRLLPALQQIYGSFTQLAFVGPAINKLYDDYKNLKLNNENEDLPVLLFNKTITLKNIHYSYPNSSRSILKDINLTISSKTTVGLVGVTGSGKTTLVDIILGLLEPQKGTLEIDGKLITNQNIRSWQRSIGYVPQHIYLTDDTIAANIAFGVDAKNISLDIVEKVSKIANLHEFIIMELPKKYQTTIGERGVRLSGGQRQRIGIARALYHNPQLLILDEATSALDNQTEQVVIDAINNLSKDITIILIAHRLNTVKRCDIIFKLNKGQIIGKGSFDEVFGIN
jgi:ABC-type multidrug transport system fused ATPase/permease subunit